MRTTMNCLVSIVVPVYNMAESIEHCVQSLLAQDYSPLEVILVDDGSKDNSYDICKKIAEVDNRVKVIHTENRGSGPARNEGIMNSSGSYIYFPDADDYLEPTAITKLVKATENGKYDLIVFGYRNANPDGSVISEKKYKNNTRKAEEIRREYSEYMTNAGAWCIQGAPWNKFFSLTTIKNNHVLFPPLRRHQDEGFIGRYMCCAQNVRFIEDVLYTYYVNDLQAEWKKYPVDYIEAVIGLYAVRKETILTWNNSDVATHDMITREYICNIIKSLELSFSPKMALKKKKRMKWIKEAISKSGIEVIHMPDRFKMPYQRLCLSLIHLNAWNCLYVLLDTKIFAQKNMRTLNRSRKG